MKTKVILFLMILIFGANSVIATPTAVVNDNFNNYTNGSVVGQGGWESYVNGDNFVVQGTAVFEGAKALYNHSAGDAVIEKKGKNLIIGKQAFLLKGENINSWGYVDVRVTKGSWALGYPIKSWISVNFMPDGYVAYYNNSTGSYHDFSTFTEGNWTLLEIEWRFSDATARYRVNGRVWTDWHKFAYPEAFSGFDHVGLELKTGTSGGVYFDALGAEPLSEPSTITLLIIALISIFIFRLYRKKNKNIRTRV